MAKKITELTEVTSPITTDELAVVSGGETKRTPIQGILDLVPAGGGGSMTLIGTAQADFSASLTITGLDDSTYAAYLVVCSRFQPTNDSADLWCRLGDPTIRTTGYVSDEVYNGTYNAGVTTLAMRLHKDVRSSTDGTGNGWFTFHPFVTDSVASIVGQFSNHNGSRGMSTISGKHTTIDTGVDRIEILFDTGNIKYGRVTVWGMSHD